GALSATVLDVRPQVKDGEKLTSYPYVIIGAIECTDYDTQTKNGFDVAARIHFYSRSASMKEVKELQGDAYALLHNQAIGVTGFNLINLRRLGSDASRESDGTMQGVCEYRALLESA
ncbi:MAG: DUF3168 domain-containing protein, partial [Rhodobacteraceae bacterium]|nr:DUF3168 domain-containing protein [Paracoccaceae bacterium]